MFNNLKDRVNCLEYDTMINDEVFEDIYDILDEYKTLLGNIPCHQSRIDKIINRVTKLEDRLNLLEVGELQDLLTVKKISDSVIHNEKTLNETLELATEGHQAIHKVLIALMEYLKVEFNEDGKIIKSK